MLTREYTLRFITPAFLGNAEQAGEWRTPPFKAQLRQWWRMAVAEDHGYDAGRIREAEGRLFGHAWLTKDQNQRGEKISARRSLLRLRLDGWRTGRLGSAPAIGTVTLGSNSLSAALYSGYGPIVAGPRLKANAAIQADDSVQLRLAFPEGEDIERTLALMHRLGTVGGRSRNGWGSYALEGPLVDIPTPLVEWRSALQLDWAHGLGHDESGPLAWRSQALPRWEDAMRLLAQLRADMRRAVSDRLLLAYPSTKGNIPGWSRQVRLPHTLRFKVRTEGNTFVATVFHVPCRPPDWLWNALQADKQKQLGQVLAQAHRFMDGQAGFQREEAP